MYKTEFLKIDNAPDTILYKTPNGISTVVLAVRAGLMHDPVGKEGLAHYVEHGVFKGTRKGESEEIQNRWGLKGLNYNAYTDSDFTAYYLTGLSCHLEFMIEELNKLLRIATFPDEEMETEREIILTEAMMRKDSQSSSMYDILNETVMINGYDRSNIGTEESIKSITSEDMRKFKETYYTRNNMSLHIASDVSFDKVSKMVTNVWNLARIPDGVKLADRPDTYLTDVPEFKLELPFSLDTYCVVCEVERNAYSDILDEMTAGVYGVLSSEILREKLGAVYSAFIWDYLHNKNKLLWSFVTFFKKERKDEVVQAVDRHFEFKDKFTKEQFLKAKNVLLTNTVKSWSHKVVASDFHPFRDYEEYDLNKKIKNIKSVTYNKFCKWLKFFVYKSTRVYAVGNKKED